MSNIYIGHARIDENGRATGGTPGDQNGQELRIQRWYDGGWGFLARPKDKAVAEKIAAACEAGVKNEHIGYDQSGRNTLLHEAKAVNWNLVKLSTPCECDCSSFVSCCVMAGGIQIWSGGNAPTTRTLRRVLQQSGAFDILTDARYLTGPDRLCRGDILCREGSHTVIVLTDADAPRDPTPDTKPPKEPEGQNKIHSGATYSVTLPLVQRGDSGSIVETIQQLLKKNNCDPGEIDGEFGPKTEAAVIALQSRFDLETDGKVGGQTWPVLIGT